MGMGKVMKRIHLERNYGDADFFLKSNLLIPRILIQSDRHFLKPIYYGYRE